jgi:hypothetical protein
MKRENILPLMLVLLGTTAGGAIAYHGWWNWLEPVTGMATLAVAAGGWLRSFMLERKLGAVMEQKSFQVTLGLREGYLERRSIRSWRPKRPTASGCRDESMGVRSF